jgi:sensory rhodopsin
MAFTFLTIGALIMTMSFLYFTFSNRPFGIVASLVSGATALSYLIMIDGSLAVELSTGTVHYTRWLFYIISCTLLMTTFMKLLGSEKQHTTPILMLNGLVMLSGAYAAYSETQLAITIFAFGSLFYLVQLLYLGKGSGDTASKLALRYIFTGWTLFPVVFLLAPDGLGIINFSIATLLYLLLDIYTKIIFYLEVSKV